jgi:uroporphyrinogen decarboxylase
MNSLERLRCAARRQLPDLVPVAPYLGNHGARLAGIPVDRYCRSGKLMAQAQIHAWQVYQQDAVVPQSDNYYIAEGFGVAVEHQPDSTPTLKTPAINELEEIADLQVPNPKLDGRMPVYLEAIHLLSDHFQGHVAVRAPGTGPFSLASHVLGAERFLTELALADKAPGGPRELALRRLLELTTEALIAFATACLEAGAHIVQAGDSLASIDMISPRMYRRWAFPCEQKFFTALNARAQPYGAMTLLHICGNMTPVLPDLADTGAQILELDSKVDMGVAKAAVGARVCLMGNLNPVTVLWQGSVADVERAAEHVIAAAGAGGGLILGSGCEVPLAAPPENLAAMVRVARRVRKMSG